MEIIHHLLTCPKRNVKELLQTKGKGHQNKTWNIRLEGRTTEEINLRAARMDCLLLSTLKYV